MGATEELKLAESDPKHFSVFLMGRYANTSAMKNVAASIGEA